MFHVLLFSLPRQPPFKVRHQPSENIKVVVTVTNLNEDTLSMSSTLITGHHIRLKV